MKNTPRSDFAKPEAKPAVKHAAHEATRSPEDVAYPVQKCEVCDTEMYWLHCKIVCPNCGYKRDCSDP